MGAGGVIPPPATYFDKVVFFAFLSVLFIPEGGSYITFALLLRMLHAMLNLGCKSSFCSFGAKEWRQSAKYLFKKLRSLCLLSLSKKGVTGNLFLSVKPKHICIWFYHEIEWRSSAIEKFVGRMRIISHKICAITSPFLLFLAVFAVIYL